MFHSAIADKYLVKDLTCDHRGKPEIFGNRRATARFVNAPLSKEK
jgi:hypothetical protein